MTIWRAENMSARSLDFPNGSRKSRAFKTVSKIVAEYDYRDEVGDLLFQVVRFEPKDFRQRRPLGGGKWAWDIKGVRRVLTACRP
jgi:hypothetical protein